MAARPDSRVAPPRRRAASLCGLVAALLCSLAMQRPAIGSAVTWSPVLDLQGADRSLKDYVGPKGLVVFFWAGWSDRSLEELKRLDAAQKDIRDHGVGLVAVNVDHESGAATLAAVIEKTANLGITVPVAVDDGLKLFKAYGVVSVPSTAVVNEKGELVYFLAGYSHEQREELFDAVDRLAGVEHLKPAEPVARAAPAAVRRLLFGRAQLAGGRVTAARRSFESAAAADPAFADPLAELGALAIDEGDAAAATALLDKALAIDKDNVAARVEAARLQFQQGQTAEATAALDVLAPRDPLAGAYLGFARLAAGQADLAAAAFAKVIAGGWPDPRSGVQGATPDQLPPGDAARRMAWYRRESMSRPR
jgi:tetratricopeptide (TPR) repeat protein